MARPVIRFAPSPNGLLHLGHALSALTAQAAAKRIGARFLLRIEDIDQRRCRPEFEAAIRDDLTWLGIDWEEPVRRQSEHFPEYQTALDRLEGLGLLVRSYDSRQEIRRAVAARQAAGGAWPSDPDGAPLYPGTALAGAEIDRRRAEDAPYAVRLDMTGAVGLCGPLSWLETGFGPGGEGGEVRARPEDWGDVVLARKDCPTSYHLAVVVDDAEQGVSHVVRGQDLFWSTSVHRVLQRLLGLPAPVYHHHRLIRDANGRKLSKSACDTGLGALRAAGVSPTDIRRMVGLVQ